MKQLPYINHSEGIIGFSESLIAKNETNDCFVKAVASSFECPYDIAHSWVKEKFKRINREGTRFVCMIMDQMSENKDLFSNKSIVKVGDLSFYEKTKGKMKRTTLNQFIKKFPIGTYIIIVKGHAFTLKNGSVIGNKNDSKSIKKIVHFAYQII